MEVEIRRQEKLDRVEERDFRRGELLGKFMVRILYGWDNRKFEEEYLKKFTFYFYFVLFSYFSIFRT